MRIQGTEPLADLWRNALQVFEPPPDLSGSQWAEKYGHIPEGKSSIPGPIDLDLTPYMREVLDTATDPDGQFYDLMWASQLGKSTIELLIAGIMIHLRRQPGIAVLPKESAAAEWSQERFDPMVAATPCLRDLIGKISTAPGSKKGRDKVFVKTFPGGTLAIGYSGSASELASRPVGWVLGDELDRWVENVKGEGDPWKVVEARTKNFPDRKLYRVSSPTLMDRGIHPSFQKSDQRHWHVPCPACGHRQHLVWNEKAGDGEEYGVVWDKRVDPETGEKEHLPETARYRCRDCRAEWTNAQKDRAVKEGEWVPHNPGARRRGYHLSTLYSPFFEISEMVESFLECGKDPDKLQPWWNTMMAEPWDDSVEVADEDLLMSRREFYQEEPLPEDVVFLTAGVDIQEDRIELTVCGWGRGEECWILNHHVLPGATELVTGAVWIDLDARLSKLYPHPKGAQLPILATFVDSGHHALTVYKFCKPRAPRRIWAVKGHGEVNRELVNDRPATNNPLRCPLWTLGTHRAKETLFKRLSMTEDAPPRIHIPTRLDENYIKQLTAEEKVPTRRNGQRVYLFRKKRQRIRNEALDCWVYAYGALAKANPDLDQFHRLVHERGLDLRPQARSAEPARRNSPGFGRSELLG